MAGEEKKDVMLGSVKIEDLISSNEDDILGKMLQIFYSHPLLFY